MSGLPAFCPYCRHTTIHVRVAAWVTIIGGKYPVLDQGAEMQMIDDQRNAVCNGCHRSFVFRPGETPS